MSNDTLQINHQLLEQLQQDPRYAYSVDEQKPSLLSELFKQFGQHLHSGRDGVYLVVCS